MEPPVFSRRYGGGRPDAARTGTAAAGWCRGAGVLAGLISVPRFRAAIDAKAHARTGNGADRPRFVRHARDHAVRSAERCAHPLSATARPLRGDARHCRRRPRRGRRSGGERRRNPHARARSSALVVPAPAAVEGGARSVSGDDERAGDHDAAGGAAQESRGRQGRRRAHHQIAAGQHGEQRAAPRQLRAREEERRVRVDRARSPRRQDPGAGRDGRQPPGSGLPEQSGGLRRRQHATDGKGGQRAAASHRPADQLEEPPAILESDLRQVLKQ